MNDIIFSTCSNTIDTFNVNNNNINLLNSLNLKQSIINMIHYNHNSIIIFIIKDKYIVSAGNDGNINIIETKNWKIHSSLQNVDELQNKLSPVNCITFSTRCRYIGSGGKDKIVKV